MLKVPNTIFICEFCEHSYSTKSNMLMHQKTAKKCLMLRDTSITDIKCDYCEFSSIRKSVLSSHKISCKKLKEQNSKILEKKDNEKDIEIDSLKKKLKKQTILLSNKNILINHLERELKECKEQLKDHFIMIASKPTIVNTTNNNQRINNLIVADFKDSTISDKVENKFTLEYLNDGIRGVAKFTKDHIVNDEDGKHKYICCDTTRAVFKYIDENGILHKDVRAVKLKNAIKEPIIKKSKTLFINENSKLFDDIANGDDDNNTNELINEKITLLKDNFLKVKNIDDNEFDYAKEMVLLIDNNLNINI
jgi:hypothetical protein